VILRQPPAFYIEGTSSGFARPDDAVYDAISDLMSNGAPRASTVRLCVTRRSPLRAGFSGLPAASIPLVSFYAVPVPATHHRTRHAIHAEIERVKKETSPRRMKMIKTAPRQPDPRIGRQRALPIICPLSGRFGDWRELFRNVDRIDK